MDVKRTPLYDEHIRLKAPMAPFAGWDMPIHYGSILDEARHTRTAVTVFDISHMGEFIVRDDPERSSFDRSITVPVTKMEQGRCKYGFLLNDNGTVIDDLIVYRKGQDEWMVVVNASNEERDFNTIKSRLDSRCTFENISPRIVKLDVQGPGSLEAMKNIAGDQVKKLKYYGFDHFDFLGGRYLISRTGYTGELGFEIYIDADKGLELWNELLKNPAVKPAGLGARDILRLEVGLPLYGNEFTESTTPLDGGMDRFIDFSKEFAGKQALEAQKKKGVSSKLIGFIVENRRSPRHENAILIEGKKAGHVTSGVFSPHINRGIGLGYVTAGTGSAGSEISIDTGKGEIRATIDTVPFIKNTSIKYAEV